MPYRQGVRASGLRGSGRRSGYRKRRSNTIRKIWRRRPTARTQQRQIAAVTRLAIANRKRFKSTYTDWQISPTSSPDDLGYGFGLTAATWQTIRITNFDQWQSVLRMDENVNESNHTFVKRIQINMRAFVVAGYATCNFFLLRTRFPDGPRDLFNDPPTLQNGDFTQNTQFPGANIRLNAAKFKVLASKYLTLKVNPPGVAPVSPGFIPGDPSPSEHKWQWTINPNIKVHQGAVSGGGAGVVPGKWTDKSFEDLPYYDKLYVMAYVNLDPNDTRGSWYADSMATCINNL